MAYWRSELDHVPAISLAAGAPPETVCRPRATGVLGVSLTPTLTERLRRLSARRHTTLFVTLLSAYAVLVARLAHRREVAIGTLVSDRRRPEFERVLGCFVNTLVLRIALDESHSFADLMRRVHRVIVKGLEHQDLPFQCIVDELRPGQGPRPNPWTGIYCVLERGFDNSEAPPGLEVLPYPVNTLTADHEFCLTIVDRNRTLLAIFVYDHSLVEAGTVDDLAVNWLSLLTMAAEKPDAVLVMEQ
jgi:non-ribosomal peptide synthetase component F